MARESKSPEDRSKLERIQAEWANVALCGCLHPPAQQAQNLPRPVVHPAEWQPNNRCCS